MLKKLKQKTGETLIECLAAVVIILFVIAMLPGAVTAAAKINASVKDMKIVCSETRNVASGDAVEVAGADVKIYGGTITRDPDKKITSASGTMGNTYKVYQEDGFYYYMK